MYLFGTQSWKCLNASWLDLVHWNTVWFSGNLWSGLAMPTNPSLIFMCTTVITGSPVIASNTNYHEFEDLQTFYFLLSQHNTTNFYLYNMQINCLQHFVSCKSSLNYSNPITCLVDHIDLFYLSFTRCMLIYNGHGFWNFPSLSNNQTTRRLICWLT